MPSAEPTLTVSPTSFPENTETVLTFVGSGWTPDAQLLVGVEGETSTQVESVEVDGTFERTFTVSLKQGGGHRAFAHAIANPEQHEYVRLHVTNA